MNVTGWTHLTWNVWSGCEPCSEGCKYCFADTLAEKKRGTKAFPRGFELTMRPHKLAEPLRVKTPSLIFVNSMSDFFWNAVSDAWRDRMLDVMEQTPQHEYQVLTKHPAALLIYSKRRTLPRNFWAGVSIENERNQWRATVLKNVDASVRFISAEPLLGPLTLELDGIHWLISGGESGLHLLDPKTCTSRGLVELVRSKGVSRWQPRLDRTAWVRELRDRCLTWDTAFFHKQWGGPRTTSGGRELDGRTWDQFPRLPVGAAPPKAAAHPGLPLFEGIAS